MKNIYVLPTDKPSRLFNCFGKLEIGEFCATREDLQVTNQHIYITSTEEITDCNCYVINVIGDEDTKRYVFKPIEVTEDYVRKEPLHTFPSGGWCEKIILTTDPDLIKDGVQAINDEFLGWFVKNPSCDFIEIESQCLIEEKCTCDSINSICKKPYYTLNYEITTPSKDDLKIGDNTNFGIITDLNEKSACFGKNKLGVDVWYKRSSLISLNGINLDELEQASEVCIKDLNDIDSRRFTKAGFKLGAKWQSERMYSENDVWNIIRMVSGMKESGKSDIEISEYFENNKKR